MNNVALFIAHSMVISLATLCFARLGLHALTAFISLLFILANLFVIKQIELFTYAATGADAFIIGISFGINIIQEFWDKRTAQKTILISLACAAFYTIATQFQLWYVPSEYDSSHHNFVHILQLTWRLMAASLVSYGVTQLADTVLYGYMKRTAHNKFFVLRNYISIGMSQAVDTLIFTYIGLYGVMSNLEEIMLTSYVIKIVALALATPALLLARKIMKKN